MSTMAIIYHLAGGAAYVYGIVMIGLGAALAFAPGRWGRITPRVVIPPGVLLVTASSTPTPIWLDAIGFTAIIAWFAIEIAIRSRSTIKPICRLVLLAFLLCCLFTELRHWSLPRTPTAPNMIVYVIGDSISAGGGYGGEQPWPQMLAELHDIDTINLARPGARTAGALEQAARIPDDALFVILEIGGNDLLGGVPSAEYEAALRELLETLTNPNRQLVMFELPLPPFCNEYGRIQRRLAREFNVALIPKRNMASILGAPANTIDGVHLSRAGHTAMANVVWKIVKPVSEDMPPQPKARETEPTGQPASSAAQSDP